MAVGVAIPTDSSGTRDRAELILGQLDRLPTLSSAITCLLKVTSDDKASARDLIRVIEPDPSMTACILGLVRRADLGAPREDVTIAKAVGFLGFRAVRNAALSHGFFERVSPTGGDSVASARRKELWRHSIATACAAEMMAEEVPGGPTSGEAFVAGLLHDVGKIALDACFPKSYARVMDRAEREPVCVCDVENEVFGLDHTVAGRRLASRWRLDGPITEAIWLHHQFAGNLPPTAVHPGLIRIVHLADALVRSAAFGYSGSRHATDVPAACASLGIDPALTGKILAALPEAMAPLCEAIGLNSTEGFDARIDTLVRLNQELSRSNARLGESNRVLDARSNDLDVLTAFLNGLGEQDAIAEVCAVAADAVRSWSGSQTAVVVVADRNHELLHVGVSSPAAGAKRADVLEQTPPSGSRLGRLQPPLPRGEGAVRMADEATRALFERCSGTTPSGLLSAVSFDPGGVAIWEEPPSDVSRCTDGRSESRILWLAIGSAVESACSRRCAERMTQELLDLNRKLHAAQAGIARQRSLSMIAAMAGGAAHELNNPLAVISGRAQMELSRCEEPQARKVLEIIVEQAHKASEIVSELMDFAKPREPRPRTMTLSDVLQATSQHWRASSGVPADRVRIAVADPAVTLHCDEVHFAQILEAVLTNAVEAGDPATRPIEVNSSSTTSDETVRLRVRDHGVGMSPEVLEHALDPFFSSRPAGRGRGLGLSRAYRLAEINGGRLWIESIPHVGTTVTIELPARAPLTPAS